MPTLLVDAVVDRGTLGLNGFKNTNINYTVSPESTREETKP